jgi:hypothetical protein
LERLWKRGELKLTGEFDSLREKLAWRVFIGKLKATEWVSYIQPPPQQANNEPSSAESVMKYLARYLTGGPISDHRLISADARSVTFWAREGTTTGGDSKQIPVTLSRLEFTRRWCLHILPAGFTKSRTFGGWHNRSREGYLERCAIMMEASDVRLRDDATEFPPSTLANPEEEALIAADVPCPCCGRKLCLIDHREKPSWYDIMNSPARPKWYQRPAEYPRHLARRDKNPIESAVNRSGHAMLAPPTKLNAQSIPLHPAPG